MRDIMLITIATVAFCLAFLRWVANELSDD